MYSQPTLFDAPIAPLTRNVAVSGKRETSRRAAAEILAKSGAQRALIYRKINALGGMTCDELCLSLGLPPQSVSARINGLALDGWIHDGGKRRKTQWGKDATVWVCYDWGNL